MIAEIIRVRPDQVEAYLADGWRRAKARSSHHDFYGVLLMREVVDA